MNLGITDAAILANTILKCAKYGEDIGSDLNNYSKAAMKNAYSMSVSIDCLFAEY